MGVGAILAQLDDDGKEHPIVYLSRSLSPAEQNYTITELECLAIVWSVRKLHPYSDGIDFTLITDHSALQWLFDFSGTNKRLVRWSMDLQPYREHMTIKYPAGKVHTNVDPLSRAPLPICNNISTIDIDSDFSKLVAEGYQTDQAFKTIEASLNSDDPLPQFDRFSINRVDGLIHYRQPGDEHLRLCFPEALSTGDRLRLQVLGDIHDCQIAGHLGVTKIMNAVAQLFYWPGLTKDVKDYVRSCHKCQLNKSADKSYGLHRPLPLPSSR
jgi:hypothetical protein